ncbi:hypothetical protein JYQ62_27965 [Nostoc sp. UHCC 0702]|nr:hypothetical protein JYQ62_27965 [Nostoc sp. UHCC 0702]
MSCRNAIACASCVHYSIHLYSILAIACASCVSPDSDTALKSLSQRYYMSLLYSWFLTNFHV